MGCVSSSSIAPNIEHSPRQLTLKERQLKSKEKRKGASLLHNLVHEEFQRPISEVYDLIGEELGSGTQGVVELVRHKQTGIKYAMKTLPLNTGKTAKNTIFLEQLRREVVLLRTLDHPNIVRLQEVFETEESLFLIMDLCSGGDILSRWQKLGAPKRFSEASAAQIIQKIVNAVRYCHEHHVVHRDIKLENLLWEHEGPDAELQLVDFGLSAHFDNDDDVFNADVGTLYYVAPEVLGRNYTKACDCWSIGVVAYILLSGSLPFLAPNDQGIQIKIRWSKISFPKELFGSISEEAIDFIKKMLIKTPSKRMTIEEAAEHPWLVRERERLHHPEHEGAAWDGAVGERRRDPSAAQTPLSPSVITRLKAFQEMCTLKKAALGVIAHSLSPEQIKGLRKEFQKVDVEGKGEIRLVELQLALEKSGQFSQFEVKEMFGDLGVNHIGTFGFNEFLAASLGELHVDEENIRLAFDRMDSDHSGQLTIQNLAGILGEDMDEDELTSTMQELSGPAGNLTYIEFREAMFKSFPTGDMDIGGMVRAASKMSTEEMVAAMNGTEDEAAAIIDASQQILRLQNPSRESFLQVDDPLEF